MFGSCLKQWLLDQTVDEADWLIGAGLFLPGVEARGLRDMANPGTAYDDPRLGKDPQGASMDEYVETNDDNGGVHLNSGIPNRAFHLAATAIGGRRLGGRRPDLVRRPHRRPGRHRHRLRRVRGRDRRGRRRARRRGAPGLGDRRASRRRAARPRRASTTEPGSDETLVYVRRTGGFAGRTAEGSVDLASHDARVPEVRSLVDRIDLAHVAGGNPHPDMFVYAFDLCGRRAQVPEQHLTPDLSRLAVLVLEAGDPAF